jgi:3-oxoacyl-[acyl-carrier protein] reductase
MNITSHTAIITGASRGIGAETARRLCAAGCNVAVNYFRSQNEAQRLAAELGERAFAVGADVSDAKQVDEMFSAVERRFGGVDLLVNNAGVSSFAFSLTPPRRSGAEFSQSTRTEYTTAAGARFRIW